MKLGIAACMVVVTGTLLAAQERSAQQAALPDTPQAQQAIPDSPRPQVVPNAAAITPGKGAPASTSAVADDGFNGQAPTAALPSTKTPADDAVNDPAPDIKAELGPGNRVATLNVGVNFVQIPFTVKDKSGAAVPALDWREVRVYENGLRKQLRFFTSDPFPLSVAFVIDQTLSVNVMNTVNNALGAVQGGFTPYDEMAIYTYNNGPVLRTDYTGAQSPRVNAVLAQSKSSGRDVFLADPGGPLSQTTDINGKGNFDPNTAANRSAPGAIFQAPPKETHPLNDAIFLAAQGLAKRPDGRRRVIYVVSDGKEYGSKIKSKEVIRFLQTNKISLYATVVGDSATPYVGFLDRYHIPFTMRENILPQYAAATGGEAISEFRQKGIEQSFAKLGGDVRLQYTIGYYSNEPITDGKFRSVEVKVLRPGLDVVAKKGYYPSAENLMRTGARTNSTASPQ